MKKFLSFLWYMKKSNHVKNISKRIKRFANVLIGAAQHAMVCAAVLIQKS